MIGLAKGKVSTYILQGLGLQFFELLVSFVRNILIVRYVGLRYLELLSAILDRLLYHLTTINIKGESYRVKDRKDQLLKNKKSVS